MYQAANALCISEILLQPPQVTMKSHFCLKKEFVQRVICRVKLQTPFYYVYSQRAQSLLCIFYLEGRSGQKKNSECSKVWCCWLQCEYFSIIIKTNKETQQSPHMYKINLKILETEFA